MGENLTARNKSQITLLRRLLLIWIKLTEIKWHKVLIDVEDGHVNIVLYQIVWLRNPDGSSTKQFNNSFKYFPLKDLGVQVKAYKKKIGSEFKMRHLSEEEKDKRRELNKLNSK